MERASIKQTVAVTYGKWPSTGVTTQNKTVDYRPRRQKQEQGVGVTLTRRASGGGRPVSPSFPAEIAADCIALAHLRRSACSSLRSL